MKKILKHIVIVVFLMTASFALQAQTPPHPNNGTGGPGGGNNTPVGGGAPIGGGIIIMLALGIGYSASKIFDYRSKLQE